MLNTEKNIGELNRIVETYKKSYSIDYENLKYRWHPLNPISIYYRQAQERSLAEIFRSIDFSIRGMKVLDAGCGNGRFLRYLISVGAIPKDLHGIDLVDDRINEARSLSPRECIYEVGSISELPYPNSNFDMVTQLTVFSSILDRNMRVDASREVCRVLKKNGLILWYDMKDGASVSTRGIELSELTQLFPDFELIHFMEVHPTGAAKLIRYPFLLNIAEKFYPKKSHILTLLKKKN